MPVVPLELTTQSNPSRHDDRSRLINCYVESVGRDGKVPFAIYATDGLKAFSTLTDGGECRGMIATDTALWVVSARQLFRVDPTGTSEAIGGIPGDGPVYMAQNRKNPEQIAIVADGQWWIVVNGFLTQNPDADLPPPNSVTFIDGYFIFGISDALGRFFLTSIDEGTEVNSLDTAAAEGNPDKLVRVFARRRELWLMGEKTTEIWTNTGAASFPFERLGGGFIERGCLARGSVADLEGSVCWVADDGTVRLAAGYEGTRISTHAVERSIAAEADRAALTAFVYSARGHSFYVLSGANFTWVYDLTTGQWHERESYQENRWRAQWHAVFAGKNIVGDFEQGKLREMDSDTYDEEGAHLPMRGRVPIHAYPQRMRVNSVTFDTVPGVGLNSSDNHDADPQFGLTVSRNGGKTFGNERTVSVGRIGEYTTRAKINRLGVSTEDGFVLEFSISPAVIKGITAAAANVDILNG